MANAWGYSKDYPYSMVDPNTIEGLISQGNVDLYNRPWVEFVDRDGNNTHGTVYSGSFHDPQTGNEVLIPQIDNGRYYTFDEAVKRYYDDGVNLGVFDSEENATKYAKQLHEMQDDMKQNEDMGNAILLQPAISSLLRSDKMTLMDYLMNGKNNGGFTADEIKAATPNEIVGIAKTIYPNKILNADSTNSIGYGNANVQQTNYNQQPTSNTISTSPTQGDFTTDWNAWKDAQNNGYTGGFASYLMDGGKQYTPSNTDMSFDPNSDIGRGITSAKYDYALAQANGNNDGMLAANAKANMYRQQAREQGQTLPAYLDSAEGANLQDTIANNKALSNARDLRDFTNGTGGYQYNNPYDFIYDNALDKYGKAYTKTDSSTGANFSNILTTGLLGAVGASPIGNSLSGYLGGLLDNTIAEGLLGGSN